MSTACLNAQTIKRRYVKSARHTFHSRFCKQTEAIPSRNAVGFTTVHKFTLKRKTWRTLKQVGTNPWRTIKYNARFFVCLKPRVINRHIFVLRSGNCAVSKHDLGFDTLLRSV